jgi:hypothetical protein
MIENILEPKVFATLATNGKVDKEGRHNKMPALRCGFFIL